ncbi:hypothetical protein STEG23_014613, partial [Scotinomys teguina]
SDVFKLLTILPQTPHVDLRCAYLFFRTPGLFSLIDTMWPPVMPLAKPSCGESSEEKKSCLPPPTFCYIFSAHPSLGHVDTIEGDPISELYQPPVVHCLREILQTNEHGTRCSFYGRVIYQRPQLKSLLAQKEIWLLVTDITLQIQDERDRYLPKTLPIYVTPSCVLGPEVLEELTMAVPLNILFRDALRDKEAPSPVGTVRNWLCPLQKRQLRFLDCPMRPKSTVKVKLLESRISSLLMSAASKDGNVQESRTALASTLLSLQGYEVKNVLGKEMGPLLCFVQSVRTNCVTLEEIELPSS